MTMPDTWFEVDAGTLDALKDLTARETTSQDVPLAQSIEQNVPVYAGAVVRAAAGNDESRMALMAEWAWVLHSGPGVIAIAGAFEDTAPIDRATDVFERLIASEKASGAGSGDHFAKPGANDRVWNGLQKHCLADPEGFALYFGNPAIAMAAEAWLGPAYQMTAQVNRVNPGGAAQAAHRDYHLGFMTPDQARRYPAPVHALSPHLTLQGAVAHCDMSLNSGPTLYLPYSHLMAEGYLAFPRPEFQTFFNEHRSQLPLKKGDAVFFNPALMHAAGHNTSTDIHRLANLLQVSSAFGRAMETVDRPAMCRALYPALLALTKDGRLNGSEITAAIAATAEGYAFPTNLDSDPPVDGLAPKSMADLMHDALATRSSPDAFGQMLRALADRQRP